MPPPAEGEGSREGQRQVARGQWAPPAADSNTTRRHANTPPPPQPPEVRRTGRESPETDTTGGMQGAWGGHQGTPGPVLPCLRQNPVDHEYLYRVEVYAHHVPVGFAAGQPWALVVTAPGLKVDECPTSCGKCVHGVCQNGQVCVRACSARGDGMGWGRDGACG